MIRINNTTQSFDIDEEVKQWLTNKCNFEQYINLFILNGYSSLDIIKEINDKSELQQIGIKSPGHRTKIFAEIQKLRK